MLCTLYNWGGARHTPTVVYVSGDTRPNVECGDVAFGVYMDNIVRTILSMVCTVLIMTSVID